MEESRDIKTLELIGESFVVALTPLSFEISYPNLTPLSYLFVLIEEPSCIYSYEEKGTNKCREHTANKILCRKLHIAI